MDKVTGRIKFLTVSIITINEVRGMGDPKGTKCVIILLNEVIHPLIIKVIQIGNAIIIDNEICLVGVKIYGNRPIQLNNKIDEKMEINRRINFWFLLNKFLLISPRI